MPTIAPVVIGDTGPMTEQPAAAAVPPPSGADAARLAAEALYSVTAGPESTASDEDVAKAKARVERAGTVPDANWLHAPDS